MFDPVEMVPGQGDLILLCDHADNQVPPEIGDLGIAPADMARHIAYDVGARGVTLALAARLGAAAILTRASRLVIDPNRGADDPTLVMQLYDGTMIPANRGLGPAERDRRLAAYWRPYHDAIAAAIEARLAAGGRPVLLAIHSFTPQLRGRDPRPWHIGVLWDGDRRLAGPLLDHLSAAGDLVVGDNEPYHGALPGDTMWTHGLQRGLPNALIEIRNDLIADGPGQIAWAERLHGVVSAALADLDQPGDVWQPDDSRDRSSPMTQTMTQAKAIAALAKAPAQTRAAPDPQALEAAAFRRLLDHLRSRSDVQNIDLMNLAGFCRNCLSRWYEEAAAEQGAPIDRAQAREIIYGMPYDTWRALHQTEATPDQTAAFQASAPHR